jgi:membrane protease YdiL (CAAX protease family)
MTALLVAGGAALEVAAWRIVATGRSSIWTAMSVAMAILGAIAVASGIVLSGTVSALTAAAVGLAAGVALFAATRAFVAIVRGRWTGFARDASSLYGPRRRLPVWAAILLGAVLIVAGEELFWRGFVQAQLAETSGRLTGAFTSLVGFIGVNLSSGNLAVIASSIVGGAAWTALAYWSGGVLASFVCHASWTGLMIAFPAAEPGVAPAIDTAV